MIPDETDAEIAKDLVAAFKAADASRITIAIGKLGRQRGMQKIAEDAGLRRENLYRALDGKRQPKFDTVLRILNALGVELVPIPRQPRPALKQKGKSHSSSRRRHVVKDQTVNA
jgi:probable addiction module antidote protein